MLSSVGFHKNVSFFLQNMFEAEELTFTPAGMLSTSGLTSISLMPELRGTGLKAKIEDIVLSLQFCKHRGVGRTEYKAQQK